MMEDFLGDDYTMDEIREATGAHHSSEEVHVVQPLVGQSNILKLGNKYRSKDCNAS